MMSLIMFAAVLVGLLSVPLAAGKIRPNRLYGFRTPRTLADERVWFPVNRMAGRRGIVLSSLIFMMGMLASFSIIGGFMATTLMVLLGVGGLISMFISAAAITAQIDKGGPRLDLSSGLESTRKREAARKSRESLLDKLR